MRALIVGVNGQDGSYLAELLLSKGYEVHGTIRRSSVPNTERLEGFAVALRLHYADLADAASLARVIETSEPDEIYNLAALSDVGASFEVPAYTGDVTGLGVTRLLELIRILVPAARFYQAGSSEMYGLNEAVPYDERSEFRPCSPYAIAKVYAHQMVVNYRDSHGLWAVNGVAFNHESERRGVEFVTRKITLALADIVHGRATGLALGNLDSRRDWSHARDIVRGMWLALQQPEPSDYVFASGVSNSVQEFLELAADIAGVEWRDHVTTDPRLFRPLDPPVLLGDASKARGELGWVPEIGFEELVRLMVESDLKA